MRFELGQEAVRGCNQHGQVTGQPVDSDGAFHQAPDAFDGVHLVRGVLGQPHHRDVLCTVEM